MPRGGSQQRLPDQGPGHQGPRHGQPSAVATRAATPPMNHFPKINRQTGRRGDKSGAKKGDFLQIRARSSHDHFSTTNTTCDPLMDRVLPRDIRRMAKRTHKTGGRMGPCRLRRPHHRQKGPLFRPPGRNRQAAGPTASLQKDHPSRSPPGDRLCAPKLPSSRAQMSTPTVVGGPSDFQLCYSPLYRS